MSGCTTIASVFGVLLVASVCSAAEVTVVKLEETDELLANPHIGWETFYRCAAADRALQGLPSSTEYIRWYWRDVEPEKRQINWEMIDGEIGRARECGQRLAFRIMVYGTGRQENFSPEWLREEGYAGFEYSRGGNAMHWGPDLDDPDVLEHHLWLIRSLGERYDGDPDIDHVDIGSVGLWGEWHMSGTDRENPSTATCRTIIDTYFEAFPNTRLLMLIGPVEHLKYAVARGAGWRADCLGDYDMFSRSWSHMRNAYPDRIREANLHDVWKKAPVAFETCGDMRTWARHGYDFDQIFDWALEQHASFINNKSAPLPEGARPAVERVLRRLGYRFVLREVSHDAAVAPGGALSVSTRWENVGVAPCYADYAPAVSLVDGDGKRAWTGLLEATTREWLPGEFAVEGAFQLPDDLPAGDYALQVAVVDTDTLEPIIKLANEGQLESGWCAVSTVTLDGAAGE